MTSELSPADKRRRIVNAAQHAMDDDLSLDSIHTMEDIMTLPEATAARLYDLIASIEAR